ncbi:MAG: Ig-like domain-containing protein, partial [Bifidobacteriaceae bacterium]|nr:Ig-like domain-containing protein [Bifidobacteriaceae bacterium]
TSAASATVGATVEDGAIELVKDTAEAATVNDKGQVTVQFIAGDASAGASILTIPTAAETKIANGADAHRAEVAAKDAQGNPAPGTLVMFRYGVDDAHLTERAVPAGPGGVAYVEFTSRTATSYVVHAEVAGDAVVNSPETAAFAPGPFDVDRTLASFEVQDATALATGKQELWAKMRAQDAQGNPVKDQTLGFKLTASGDGAVFTPLADGLKEASGVSGADGWVEVHVVSEFEGDFPVVGTVGVEESAPQDARFVNDAADWKTSWFQVQAAANNKTDPATADGKDSYVVRVNLRNEAGDPVNGLPAEIRIVGGEDGERRFTVTTSRIGGQSGTAEYAFKSTEAGKFTLYVEVGGDQLSQPAAGGKDKSAVVQFKAGAASDAKSYLVGPKTGQAKADGNEQQVVEAYVRDAQGNPVTGGTVGFDVPSGVTAVDLASGGPVDGPAAVPVAPDANGVAAIAMVSLVKGQYEVTAKVGAMEIRRGSPAKLNFANTDVSAARSAFTIPTAGDVKTVRREFHRLRVELFDASGNAYTDVSQTVTFRWRPDGATAWAGTRDVPSSSAGVAEWPSWTVTRAGVWEVEAWIATGQVGTALKAAFKADVALETASQFESSSGAVVANDGQSAHFAQVTVLDAVSEGNPVSGQDVVFRVDGQAKISGAAGAGQEKTVASSDLGQARVEVVDAAQGGGETVAVEAFVNGVKVGSAPLDFRPGAVDPGKSALRVRPTTALSGAHPGVTADGADSYTATVTVVDGAGSVLVGQTVVFEASPGLTALESGPFRTNALGQVSATLVSRTAGSHSLRALLGTDAASPGLVELVFQSGPMASGTSYLEAPAASAVADGSDPLTVAAYVLDANSNPLAGADVRFALPQGVDVLGEAPGLDSFDAKTDKNGRAAVVLVSTRADSYGVTAQAKPAGTAAWAPVSKNSPAAAVFVAGSIDPVYSQISRTPDGPLTVGKAPEGYEVRVDLLDRYGNPVKQANVPVEFRFFLGEPQGATQDPEAYCRQAPDSATRFASGLTDADGVAKVRFLSNVAGPWYGCAFYAGDRIVGGSPAPLGFTAGSVDAAASALQVSQHPVPADGKAAHYAKVYVRDAFGNPLGGREVQISIEEGAAGVAGPNVKGSSGSSAVVSTCDPAAAAAAPAYCTAQGVFQAGLAYVEFTSEEPGVFAVAAKVGGLPVAGSGQTVSFTAGTPDSGRSSWRIAPDTADPVDGDSVSVPATGLPEDSYALTVEVRSGSNLLAPGVQVRIDGLSSLVGVEGGSLDAVTGTPESGSMGRHTWKLNSRAPGTYRGQVQVWNGASWVNVGGQFKVRFAAGKPDASSSWLVEPAGSVSVAGPAPALLEARVADAQGNPVDQGTVVFQLPAGVWPEGRPQDAGSAVEVGVAGGSAVVRLAAEKAGRYGVGASIKGADPAAILTVKSSGGVILSDEGLAYVEFTAGAVSGRDSSLTIPTANAPLPVGGGYHRAEVLVTDAHGNPVSGPEVEFSWAVGTADGPSGQVWTKVETPVEANAQGVAAYEFAAPGNAAGWVWIKASVAGAAGAEAVGGPQTAPAAAQTVAGAQFTAAAAATATLTTYDGAVPNDMAGRAWARVVVADQYGNGVGGVPVAFTLPAQTAAPVFLEDGNPTGAATTVVTCGDEPADPPAACLVGGVYTPGLALAQAVSAHEGVFPVGAVAGSGPDGIVLAPSNVVFSSGAASAAASSFKLERTDAKATHVVADAAQSYTLTVTAANGVTGAVAGACVAPDLPAGVTVAAPKSGAPCAAGEYAADSSGVAALRIVSRVAGVAGVGVQLGGSPV